MAVDLSGYNTVAERLAEFRAKHPEGSLQPVDPAKPFEITEIGGRSFIIYTAAAYRTPDDPRPGIGVAWEPFPGRTPYTKDSELMNSETSAWGRAIVAALAADTVKGVATAEEIRNREEERQAADAKPARSAPSRPAQRKQEPPQDLEGLVTRIEQAKDVAALREAYRTAGDMGALPKEIAVPKTGEKLTVQGYLQQRKAELEHKSSPAAAAGAAGGTGDQG